MQSLWTHHSPAELENHLVALQVGWSGAPARLPSWVPIPGLVLDRPQAQEHGYRSSDHIPVLLFTLEFIYGPDSGFPPTPYRLREPPPHNLIWPSITPIPASSRRDRDTIG